MNIKHSVLLSAVLSLSSFSALAADFSEAEVCKATIAFEFGKNPGIIDAASGDGYISLQYIRPDDETLWKYHCRVQSGNKILWRTAGSASEPNYIGRWRNDPMDPTITYSVSGDGLTITDSEMGDKSFKRSELK
ncbi:hypothetical protein IBT47_10585 [Erwinia sp. S43]|uniref:hypothetical protein n=1 Tax=Erwinia sp. S43 TaxID=2769339 RepID=UPI00190CF7DF|nr:hypothetical protein [Erwinia sp. S43]MBK0032727.1 hypothetical protein [Erwinia sp. S43]